jgi:hypothetical protein
MHSFAKRLHINQYGDFDFVFTGLYVRNSEHFKVEVFNGEAKVCRFTMKPVLHYWMIADAYNLPEWVCGVEMQLEKAINQNQYSAVK